MRFGAMAASPVNSVTVAVGIRVQVRGRVSVRVRARVINLIMVAMVKSSIHLRDVYV